MYYGCTFTLKSAGILYHEGMDYNILLVFGQYGWCATLYSKDDTLIRECKHKNPHIAVKLVVCPFKVIGKNNQLIMF